MAQAVSQSAILSTIAGLKRKRLRTDDASESDSEIQQQSNRGNKLKRKAKFVSQGRLDQADGPRVYRRKLNYNGFERHTISRNPPMVDPDGDVVDEDEEDSDADLTPAEEDPYADVQIHQLLKPLTSPAELDKHPTLSLPYKSKILDEMVQSTQEMVFREQDTLWRVKPLLSQFLGDAPYAPDGNFETDQDALLFRDFDGDLLRTQSGTVIGGSGALPLSVAHPGVASAARPEIGPEDVAGETGNGKNSGASADVMQDIENEFNGTQKRQINSSSGTHDPNSTNGLAASIPTSHQTNGLNDHGSEKANATKPEDVKNVSTRVLDERPDPDGSDPTAQPDYPNHEHMPPGQESTQQRQPHQSNGTDPDDADSTATSAEPQTHRMTTRARAQPPPRSTSPTPPPPQIHPLFIPPPTSLPQPPAHSTEIRRLLCSYTQKQEEVVRQGNALLDGLRKALRLRNTVWGWCRAEGHVGEMSDGEDWIDLEEWGVEGPLRKGEEVEDEDGGGILVGKGRRHRRAV